MHTYEEIEVSELNQHLSKPSTILVDVRNHDEVIHGIIESAIHIPLAKIPNHINELTKMENVIFYCHSGIRSAHAAAFLANQTENKHIYNLIGGVVAWNKAGYPFVEKSK